MRKEAQVVSEKVAELFGVLKQAKTWKLPLADIASLMEIDRNAAKYFIHCLRKKLKKSDSPYIVAHEPDQGYFLADTRTPEGAKAATRESLKSGRRLFGHSESSSYYHRRIDPAMVVDAKTAKLYAVTSLYNEGNKMLVGLREASLKLLSSDSEAAKEHKEAEDEALDFIDKQAERFSEEEHSEDDDGEDIE